MWLKGRHRTRAPAGHGRWMRWHQLQAEALIVGHRDPWAADDDARRQIDECRRYIADFEAAPERSSAAAELIDRMMSVYPGLANPYTLWVAA